MPTYFTPHQERMYERVKAEELRRGRTLADAKRIAAATVNKYRAKRRGRRG
jgi:hypothetical protein